MRKRMVSSVFGVLRYAVSAVLVVCIVAFSISGVFTLTLGNFDYTIRYFTKGRTVDVLAKDLENKYDALSRESGVPKEVYMNATGANLIRSVQSTVVKNTQSSIFVDFSGTTDIEKRLDSEISKHDKTNKIKRSKRQKQQLIRQAVDVFNQTCSIANNAQLSRIASLVNNRSLYLAAASVMGIFVCIAAQSIFSGRRKKSFNNTAMSMVTAGGILVSLCAIVLAGGTLSELTLTNIEAYNLAISSAAKDVFLILFAIGILLIAAGFFVFHAVFSYYRISLMESDTENEIAKNLILNSDENESY